MAEEQVPDSASIGLAKEIAQSYDADNRGIPRLVAQHLLTLVPAIQATSVIHDNASGPAVVTSEILALQPDLTNSPTIVATDIAPPMITATQGLIENHKWKNVTVESMDSCKLTFENEKFSHSITNLGIFMTADPVAALTGVRRTLKVGGTAAITGWKAHGFLELLRRISRLVRPDAVPVGPLALPMQTQKELEAAMLKGGFTLDEIKISSHAERLKFEDESDLITLMTGKISSFVTKDWTPEEVKAIPDAVMKVLDEDEWTKRSLPMEVWVVIAEKKA